MVDSRSALSRDGQLSPTDDGDDSAQAGAVLMAGSARFTTARTLLMPTALGPADAGGLAAATVSWVAAADVNADGSVDLVVIKS
jgi:hypothetical protein